MEVWHITSHHDKFKYKEDNVLIMRLLIDDFHLFLFLSRRPYDLPSPLRFSCASLRVEAFYIDRPAPFERWY